MCDKKSVCEGTVTLISVILEISAQHVPLVSRDRAHVQHSHWQWPRGQMAALVLPSFPPARGEEVVPTDLGVTPQGAVTWCCTFLKLFSCFFIIVYI